jgi:hypothetical protein
LLGDAPRRVALGENARRFVEQGYSWQAHLRAIDEHLPIDDHLPLVAANEAGACHA